MKIRIDTPEAIRTAIAQLQGIKVYDPDNYTEEMHKAKHILKENLLDIICPKVG